MLQRTICATGPIQDVSVRSAAQVCPHGLHGSGRSFTVAWCLATLLMRWTPMAEMMHLSNIACSMTLAMDPSVSCPAPTALTIEWHCVTQCRECSFAIFLQAVMVAWGETMVKGAAPVSRPSDLETAAAGNLLANLPSRTESAQEKLMQTQNLISASLALSSSDQIASRFKNFDS